MYVARVHSNWTNFVNLQETFRISAKIEPDDETNLIIPDDKSNAAYEFDKDYVDADLQYIYDDELNEKNDINDETSSIYSGAKYDVEEPQNLDSQVHHIISKHFDQIKKTKSNIWSET